MVSGNNNNDNKKKDNEKASVSCVEDGSIFKVHVECIPPLRG